MKQEKDEEEKKSLMEESTDIGTYYCCYEAAKVIITLCRSFLTVCSAFSSLLLPSMQSFSPPSWLILWDKLFKKLIKKVSGTLFLAFFHVIFNSMLHKISIASHTWNGIRIRGKTITLSQSAKGLITYTAQTQPLFSFSISFSHSHKTSAVRMNFNIKRHT